MLEPVRELSRRHWSAYAVAAAATLGALWLQLLLSRWLGDSLLPLTLATLAAAWYGGLRPGLFATALGSALACYALLPPRGSLLVEAPVDRAQLLAFLLVGGAVSRICEAFRDTRRRLEAERARLRESDTFHAAIADLSTDFAFSARVEADGTIVTEAVTEGFTDLLGYTLPELRERGGWSGLVHAQDAERARAETRQLLRGRAVEGEARHVARDGAVVQLQYRFRPLWDERGRVVRVYGAYRDVTRQRDAEREARERERQLRLVSDHSPVLLAHHDAAGRFKFVNAPYAARFGLEPADVVGQPLQSLLGEERFGRVARHVEAALAGRRVQFEDELPAEGGEPEPVRVAYQPERDASGRVVGFVAAIVSVADQRRAREALRKSEERLRLALQGARQGTWDWEIASGRVTWDDRCAEIFGWKRGATVTFEDHLAVVHPDERQAVAAALRRSVAECSPLEHEHRIGGGDSDARWVQLRGHAFYDAARKPIRMSGTVLDVTERRRLQDALRESEARFRQLTEAMPHIAFSATPEGAVEYVNSQWYRFAGRPEDESFGLGWMQVLHPDDYGTAYRRWTRSLRTGEPFETEYRFKDKDGTFRWHLCRALPVRDASGRVVKWVGTSTDVHEQRQLTEQLAAERGLLDAVFATSPVGLAVVDRQLRFLRVNEVLAALDDVPASEHAGRPVGEVAPALWSALEGAYRQVLASGQPVANHEISVAPASEPGAARHWLASCYPIRTGEGIVGVGTAVVDVTEQKRTQAALERSERLYRAIGESIEYGVWVCDAAGRNVYASESFLKLVGLTQEQCAGFGWADALHPDEAERTLASWHECVREGAKWDVEERFLGGDGAYHPVLARGVRVPDAQGRTLGWAGIHLDISRLKHAEDALRAADRRKDEFLATLAHELRNPLNPIRSAVEVLRLKGAGDAEQEWTREVIDRQVDHLTRLIDDLLDVSRIGRGKLELRREPVDLAEVIRGALDASRPLVEKQGHELQLELPDEPLPLQGDVVRLTQVFTNLLTNAAKYTERGGRIAVAARREGTQAVVTVSDTGVGIAAEKLPHLFEMFYQVDRSLERAQGGLGIGLSLVKQLVAMHGGAITARSAGVGQGSEFLVRLPLQSQPPLAAAPPVQERGSRAAAGEARRILVVDDNADSASSLALVLQLAGHDVDTAGDGEEALAKAAREHPDVMLLDIGMPKLNGYEVCRRIRAEPWGSEVLLIAQTGWGQEEDRRRTREAGFDAHLVKPIEPSALARLIQGLGGAEREASDEPPPRVH